MAIVDDTAKPAPKGPSTIVQLGVLAVLTAAAIGIGWGAGLYLDGGKAAGTAAGAHGDERGAPYSETRQGQAAGTAGIVYLDPITANLDTPPDMWARIEVALVFDGEADLLVAQLVQQDILAYMRTLKYHQLDGASGFQHLKTDLEERAGLRSEGEIKRVLVRSLLFE